VCGVRGAPFQKAKIVKFRGQGRRRFVPGESTTLWRVLGPSLPVARACPLAKSAACHVARVSSDAYIARLSLFYPGKSAGRSKFPPPTAFLKVPAQIEPYIYIYRSLFGRGATSASTYGQLCACLCLNRTYTALQSLLLLTPPPIMKARTRGASSIRFESLLLDSSTTAVKHYFFISFTDLDA
jgi:hypothetical protein